MPFSDCRVPVGVTNEIKGLARRFLDFLNKSSIHLLDLTGICWEETWR